MIRSSRCAFSVLCLLCTAVLSYAVNQQPIFWESEFNAALDARDSFYALVGVDTIVYRSGNMTDTDKRLLADRLARFQDLEHPWFNFLSGVVLSGRQSTNNDPAISRYIDMYFSKALSLSEHSPGASWALFYEFRRFRLYPWAEKSLQQLEKQFLEAGAQASPLVAQQLLQCALQDRQEFPQQADRWIFWSQQFDYHQSWATILKINAVLPWGFPSFFSLVRDVTREIADTWVLQLAIAPYVIHWLILALSILVAALVLVLGLKHLGKPLHPLMHLYPRSVPPQLRQVYVVMALFAFIFFGLLPFLWLVLIIVWRHCSRSERIMAGVCACLLVLAPLACRIETAFCAARAPEGTLALFQRSLDDGYDPMLHARLREHADLRPADYLAHIAAANFSIKNQDVAAAQGYVAKAEALQPDDPVVMLMAGNVAYYSHDTAKANDYYTRCIKMFPELEATFFNPCIYYFSEMKFMEGMNLIETAGKRNQARISTFVKKNDDYFAGSWPTVRHVLQPDYRPSYFWSRVFPRYIGSWRDAQVLWGGSFLGLCVIPYCAVCALCIIVLSLTRAVSGVKKIFFCKMCGVPVCRRCRTKEFCSRCAESVENVPDQAMYQTIMSKFMTRHYRTDLMARNFINAVFPGMGPLFVGDGVPAGSIVLAGVTSGVYASYAMAFSISFLYPFGAAIPLMFLALLLPAAYSIAWVIYSLVLIKKGWKGQ
jgi:tetratricopeptide (TPR) repeat protein